MLSIRCSVHGLMEPPVPESKTARRTTASVVVGVNVGAHVSEVLASVRRQLFPEMKKPEEVVVLSARGPVHKIIESEFIGGDDPADLCSMLRTDTSRMPRATSKWQGRLEARFDQACPPRVCPLHVAVLALPWALP